MRVLIVDDNLELLESLALARQRERAADVLITDIFMSGGGRMAKGNYLETARVVGADAMLRKPFAPERLLAMLDSFRDQP